MGTLLIRTTSVFQPCKHAWNELVVTSIAAGESPSLEDSTH